jgi:uncharacterized protein (DUF488 family)
MNTTETSAKSNAIYTIGYGNRTIEEFILLLQQYQIQYIADVRSAAYSKYNEDFSKSRLSEHLKAHSIGYLFMGDQLGGKPKDVAYYTEGKADYDKLKQADFYQEGIARLQVALAKGYRVALMCSELKPEMCHRSKLIGQTLEQNNIVVEHIDETGLLRSQQEVIDRLTHGQLSFFEPSFTSRQKYLKEEETDGDEP